MNSTSEAQKAAVSKVMWNRTVFDFCPNFLKIICTTKNTMAYVQIAGTEVWAC
jgi:hypothetical protein